MRIDIITIFPNIFKPILGESIIKRAQKKGLLKIAVHNLRDYTKDKHRKIDDRPFGGGPGMVFKPEPIFDAIKDIKSRIKGKKTKVVLLTPQGKTLNQRLAQRISKSKNLILICGHYEGVDERVRQSLVDEEVSIGDYILTGGELPAMVLVDTIARLIPGVLGDKNSAKSESFYHGLLEYPQYTRPADYKGKKVPKILLSGDHQKIAKWRKEQAYKVTKRKRPELLIRPKLTER
ncbi:MAG: tRNA (guanosine(37)-N1)-methyltransferase TrmD [Candidatus Omnitrophica bacterium]|nr:tRNA (guanosine(37)-N1)-methyltransferase TrmD [Candidatus Omnitrophota bacterium]